MTDDPGQPRLRLYNTLTRRKEPFAPIDPANVRMYACGPTVYDFAHIGNARPVIVFDLLFRLLRHLYGPAHVTYVRNITDVDDRINARAARDFPGLPLNDAIRRVTTETERQFHEDIRALGVLMPDDVNVPGERPRMVEPRATEHIAEMRELIDRLVGSGHAYVAADHVLFDVPSMPDYGGLSRRPLDEMEAGARVDVAPYKRSPLDFVLWKPSTAGEPAWPSPAGIAVPGRPGWHIECSAMSWKHLGERFDIHAGGLDLIFPHHENEIAQTRCCFGTPAMADVWMHNGFLQVEGEKMSKSLGNFVTIRDVLRDWPGEVVRLNMLKTHYRQPIDWTVRGLEETYAWMQSAYRAFEAYGVEHDVRTTFVDETERREQSSFFESICDDLNTPKAVAVMSALMKGSARPAIVGRPLPWVLISSDEKMRKLSRLRLFGSFLNIFQSDIRTWDRAKEIDQSTVERRLDDRKEARAAKNWAESDRIRDELKAMGVQLKDNKDGTTTWEVMR